MWATWGDFALENMALSVSEMETVSTKDASNEKPWIGAVALLAKWLPSNYQALCLSPSTINWVRWSIALTSKAGGSGVQGHPQLLCKF